MGSVLRIARLAALIAGFCTVQSCTMFMNPGGKTGGSSYNGLSRLDLSGAKALAIVPKNAVSRAASREEAGNVLVKVTAEGAMVTVTNYDKDGNPITSESTLCPNDLFSVDTGYILATYWIPTETEGTYRKVGYLVRESDGAVFSLENAGVPQQNVYFQNEPQAFIDSAGNIYYKKETVASGGMPQGDTAVVKVNTADPAHLTAQVMSMSSDRVQHFAVDPAGNVLYYEGGTQRMRKRTGGYYNLSGMNFWIGLQGEIFCIDSTGTNGNVRKLSVADDGTVTASNYGTTAITMYNTPDHYYLFRSAETILCVGESGSDQYTEIYNTAGEPRTIAGLPSLGIQAAVASQNGYYYMAGEDSETSTLRIIKVKASDYSYSDIVTPGDFDNMYQMMVEDDGTVTFNAMRMSDGKKVLAEVSPEGTLTILDEEMDAEIVELVRLN